VAVGAALVTAIGATTIIGATIQSHPQRTTMAQNPAGAAAAALTSPQATRSPAPASQLLPHTYTLPGTRLKLPWPANGQASIEVQGIGSLGSTGSGNAAPIASVAKVMTAYIVLHDHPLNTHDDGPTLTVSPAEAAAYPQERANNESLVPVTAGEVLTERQALEALLLPSADNIARILARWDAGSITTFLDTMNTTAAQLGMTNTHYTDPSGLAESTTSTADDQIKLAEQALKSPAFRQIVALSRATIPIAGVVTNYNTLLGSDGVIGIKTGSTSAAGGCLLFAANRQIAGQTVTIIGAVFGQHGTTLNGLPQALTTSQRLIQTAAAALSTYTVIKAGQPVATNPDATPLVAPTDITVLGWPGLTYKITVKTTPSATTVGITNPSGTTTTTKIQGF
jgi:D-alanyl-D-alanine carboxypeptidase (penicillin-binding protein 5/6)